MVPSKEKKFFIRFNISLTHYLKLSPFVCGINYRSMKNRIVWKEGENIFVVRKGKTSNDKISNGKPLVQTYTFSEKQWVLASTSKGFGMKKFFALDGSNCLDCPYSGNQGKGGCYTHKFNQYVGFLSMLRSISIEDLTPLDRDKQNEIIKMSFNTYVRFGTYGEPSLLPISLINGISYVADGWTGYTHQWEKKWANEYSQWFMASTHDAKEQRKARTIGFRSFIATTIGTEKAVSCPASKEMDYKSNCAKCGLCSGMLGKGTKDIKILEH
tara:strand:- start:63 stop:872 length:810 start_codon:yes stop_codon:yes gene_type:complete